MNINTVNSGSRISSFFSPPAQTVKNEDSFSSVLNEALQSAAQTEAVDNAGNLELVSGDTNALHTTLIDAEKAEIALQLTLQIRNKVIDAYSEIMHMSI